jgi:hypothetical protein
MTWRRLAGIALGVVAGTALLLSLVAGAVAQPPAAPPAAAGEARPCQAPDQGASGAGLYQGQVVELLSDRPIADALVLFVWFRDCDDEANREAAGTVLARTDADGRFSVDARSLEAALPRPWLPPRVLVYRGGYASFPPRPVLQPYPTVFAPVGRLAGLGGRVPLRPISDLEELSEVFNLVTYAINRLPDDVGKTIFRAVAGDLERELARRKAAGEKLGEEDDE